MSIYIELKEAGIPIDNHESDLYVLVTPESSKIVERYRKNRVICVSTFRSNIDGKTWFDIPFCYDPYWNKCASY